MASSICQAVNDKLLINASPALLFPGLSLDVLTYVVVYPYATIQGLVLLAVLCCTSPYLDSKTCLALLSAQLELCDFNSPHSHFISQLPSIPQL